MCIKVGGVVLVLVALCGAGERKTCFFSVLSHSQCMHVLNIYDGWSYMEKPSLKRE